MSISLAIVIPAYKGKFLAQTIEALIAQTCREFTLYVFDDNSPDNIATIVNSFREQISIIYHRFSENIGHRSLTDQWARCLQFTGEEDWIWLLPDDDFPSSNCVEIFKEASCQDFKHENLYRFQTVYVDEENNVIMKSPYSPPLETNVDFIVKKLQFERISSVAEYIFSKKQFFAVGGFTKFPLGWCSDDLLWMKLSQKNDIITLPAGVVSLRQSSLNISNNSERYAKEMIKAKYMFFAHLLNDKFFLQKVQVQYSLDQFRGIIARHLFFEYKSHALGFRNLKLLTYAVKNSKLIGGGFLKNVYRLLRYEFRTK